VEKNTRNAVGNNIHLNNKTPSISRWYAVVVAGGSGRRFGGDLPKQFLPLQDKPVLLWSIDTFFACRGLQQLVVAAHSDWLTRTREILSTSPHKNKITVVEGGPTRQISCYHALKTLPGDDKNPVLIHDAARPWITQQLIQRVLAAVQSGNCVIPAIEAVDSIVTMKNGVVIDYPDRSSIGYVQTPQGFPLDVIQSLHQEYFVNNKTSAADDGSIAMKAGFPVIIVPGDPGNKKITVSQDIDPVTDNSVDC